MPSLLQAQTAHQNYIQSTLATGLTGAKGIAIDSSGNLYIAAGNVVKETLSGGSYTESTIGSGAVDSFGGGGIGSYGLYWWGICVVSGVDAELHGDSYRNQWHCAAHLDRRPQCGMSL